MINKKALKIASLTSIFTLLFTSFTNSQIIFAANTNATKKHYDISYIYSNKSSTKEKLEYANSKNYDSSKKVRLNEFDLYKEIDNKKGLDSTSQNSMVKKYKDTIKKLNSKNDTELKNLGFDSSRITALRKSKLALNNNNLEQIGSTLTVSVNLDSYYHDMQYEPNSPKFKTLIYAIFSWSWSQAPLVTDTDGLGVEWLSNSQDKLQVYYTSDVVDYYNAIYNTVTSSVDYADQAL
ncbi:hydroxylamine reductase (hybrid-cluster protein), partial [Clostridium acetobutylicum]